MSPAILHTHPPSPLVCQAEDAIAALELYQAARTEWEAAIRTNTLSELKPAMASVPRKSAFAQRSAARKARQDGAGPAEAGPAAVLAAATSTTSVTQVTETSAAAAALAGASTTPKPTQVVPKPKGKPASGPARGKPRTIKVMRRVDVKQAAMAFMAR